MSRSQTVTTPTVSRRLLLDSLCRRHFRGSGMNAGATDLAATADLSDILRTEIAAVASRPTHSG